MTDFRSRLANYLLPGICLTFCLALGTAHALTDDWSRLLREAEAKSKAQRAVPATGVTLVLDGNPLASIVAGPDAKAQAAMLAAWLEMMSGAKVPVVATAPEGDAPAIYLGAAAIEAGLVVEPSKLVSNERFRVVADGRRVLIGSAANSGLTRGVGRFLEEAFGCRWFATTAWSRVYPKSTTLRVRDLDFSEEPTALMRRIWGANGAFRDRMWDDWNGDGGLALSMSHSWGFVSQIDFAAHPDWFRMNEKGERVKGPWPNFGNPELRQAYIDWAVAESRDGTANISLSPPDSYQFDYSPEAAKYDNPNVIVDTSGMVSMTDRFMGIVNDAAKAIYAKGQTGIIGFYAYSDYTTPPTAPELEKLSPNICVWIAPIRYSRYHSIGHPNSGSMRELRGVVEGWSKHASMIGYRTYNNNLAEILTPFSKLSIWSHDMPYLHSKGCIGYNLESMDSWELSGPHLYLSIRLAYDPTQAPREIIADYFVNAYGPAAVPMAEYWLTLDEAWSNQKTEAGSIHVLPTVWTPELFAALNTSLTVAEAAAKDDANAAKQVDVARRGYRRAEYWRTWFQAWNAGDTETASATYAEWLAFVSATIKVRDGNDYDRAYLSRFVKSINDSAFNAMHPKDQPVRQLVTVLPDEWRYATGEYVETYAAEPPVYAPGFDDNAWPKVRTMTDTLSGQGYSDYFGDMWYRTSVAVPADAGPGLFIHVGKADRKVTVFVNGRQVNTEPLEGFKGCTVDVTGFVEPGKVNQITLRITHIPLPELYLGGLIGPVYLLKGAVAPVAATAPVAAPAAKEEGAEAAVPAAP